MIRKKGRRDGRRRRSETGWRRFGWPRTYCILTGNGVCTVHRYLIPRRRAGGPARSARDTRYEEL